MSARDEGKTHFYGDDCPGGHRAANVAGVCWDDQETAAEANEREAAERQGLAAAGAPAVVTDEMVDTAAPILRSLMKSHGAPIGTEAAERWVRDILADVVPLIRAQVAAELSGWPFDGQVAEALRRLDGSTASGVALLTGMSRDEIERVGGVTPAEEEPTDVHAAFEAGETGQPTALVTVDPADLLTALNQRTGHSHMRPGIWDADNRPEIANKPCVECAARGRLRAALADTILPADSPVLSPLPPVSGEMREHPGHDVPMVGVPMAADGVERTYDLGYLSLPAEIQAEAEQAVSAGTPQPLLVPTGPPRDPHAATVPFEAFVGDHPDHIDWVRDTGKCMASGPHECVTGASTDGQERSEGDGRG